MPPVRWKLLAIAAICLIQGILHTSSQAVQDTISITSDGWRPIVGTHKPHFYDVFGDDRKNIKDVVSTLPSTQTYLPTTQTPSPTPHKKQQFRGSAKPANLQGRKKTSHSKHPQINPYYALPVHGTHGPHIPLNAVTHTRPSQIGQIKKYPPSSKPFVQISGNGKRNAKPSRVQTSTHSTRDEIFTASATSGAYNFYNQGPISNVKTRETIGLGLPVTNHYSISQPHAHIEFNRFALPSTSESVFQQYNNPVQGFIFAKHPQTNDVNYQFQNQDDEYTRNLVPPPQLYKNKDISTVKETQDKRKLLLTKPSIPDDVIVQVPSPYQFSSQKINEPTVTQVQVTKEKLNVFHNNIPTTYTSDYVDYDFHRVRKPTETSKPTYEVTEGKVWQETPQYSSPRPPKSTTIPKRRPVDIELDVLPFLPTPFRPESQSIEPTSPTQAEVSTIFTKLSKLQRERQRTTPDPLGFHVKEVSTHYPILGKPIFGADPTTTPELSNEITTTQIQEEIVTTTKETPRVRPHRRRRPDHRRTTTTTTTEQPAEMESYELQRTKEVEAPESVETERPVRRRPMRYRTTTPPPNESEEVPIKVNRGRNRHRHRISEASNYEPVRRRIRPVKTEVVTEEPEDKKITEDYYRHSSQATSASESEEAASEKSEEIDFAKLETIEQELPGRHYVSEAPQQVRYETIRPFIEITTTEKPATTNLVTPENEIELTSDPTIEEITTTALPTTTTTTATTTTVTTNSHRIRGRPLKFDNSNRPRFSVKEYRQKLSQYTSTTSTEPPIPKATESLRIRVPNRLRRPTSTLGTTYDEETTESSRTRFVPKEPRHSGTTEDANEAVITEKYIKSVNTRLRPFGRHRSTTVSTTSAPKVSIKPNLFSRRRPPMLTLRSKIYNKNQKNNTEATTTAATTEMNEVKEGTLDYDQEPTDISTTEINWKRMKTTEAIDDVETTTISDISKLDSYFYSQRVSDLTSSAKNDYNTFKSVSPSSRRIPNHFTIATDDPILPIEAFFPNIKDKARDKDS